MKKTIFTLFTCLLTSLVFADSLLIEGFEYANHDMESPVGWVCEDQSWLCGYHEKDHNRIAHTGNWYAFTNADDSWMFMEIYMSTQLRYRYSCWAISDGSYQLEFWGGDSATPDGMTQRFVSATVNSDNYEKISVYIETLSQNHRYFGIHAIATDGAQYLTIDDVFIDKADRYNMEINPYEIDTVIYPGSSVTYSYTVHNTGYESMHIYMTGYSDYFTNVQFTEDGLSSSSFWSEADQITHCTCTATLRPDVQPGSRVWIDIMFTVSCDCITRMSTIWANVLGEVDEFPLDAHFDTPQYLKDGWVVIGDKHSQWSWVTEGADGCQPIDDSPGMLRFNASETNSTSFLVSPKLVLNETGNQVRLYLYRSGSNLTNDGRVNIYLNTEMTPDGATSLGTVHRSIALSPVTEETGWYQYDITFDSPNTPVFLIIEGVGDFAEDLYLDEIAISNTTLPASTVTVAELGTPTEVRVAPNPAKDLIQVSGNGLKLVQLIDATGRLLKSVTAESDVLQLTLEDMEPGLYFIHVTTAKGTSTHKTIKR